MARRQVIAKAVAAVLVATTCCAFAPSYAYAEWGSEETTVLVEIEDGVVSIIPGRLDLIRAEIQNIIAALTSENTANESIGSANDTMYNGTINGILKWMKEKWRDPANVVNSKLSELIGTTSDTQYNTTINGLLKWMKEKWRDPANVVNSKLEELIGKTSDTQYLTTINGLLKWMKQNWSSGSGGGAGSVNYTEILNGIQEDIENVYGLLEYWMNNDNDNELIGDIDWTAYGAKANRLADTVSSLAPFGGALLVSEVVAIISTQGGLDNPGFEFDFDFGNQQEHFAIDMAYMSDARPLFNFFCVMMLILSLGYVSIRVMELEAAT